MDSISKIYDMYEDYKILCGVYDLTPIDMGDISWLHQLRELEGYEEVKTNESN